MVKGETKYKDLRNEMIWGKGEGQKNHSLTTTRLLGEMGGITIGQAPSHRNPHQGKKEKKTPTPRVKQKVRRSKGGKVHR